VELNNSFTVDRPIEEAWALLTDVERIAPCMPGAQLEEVEGDEYRGSVKVKVGPITAQYKGKATFVEKDEAAHRAVLKAEGRDSRGQGNANALVTATLSSEGGRTNVAVHTDLTVTGKVAQFGRGVMAEVSEKLLGQFVDNLEAKVLSQVASAPTGAGERAAASQPAAAPAASATPSPAAPHNGSGASSAGAAASSTASSTAASSSPASGEASSPGVRKIAPTGPVEPVDLLEASGASIAKRVVPVIGVVVLLLLLLRRRRHRRG
jgi:carbon monoxide dehydrogenase subunit G